jgi:probable O-glycosylation ligase (exosortase A-associated)
VRDLVTLGFMLAIFPLAISSIFSAYLMWGWAGLISLNSYLTGQMGTLPYVQIFAIITLALVLMSKDKSAERFSANRTTVIFVLILLHGLMSAALGYPGLGRNWELYTNMVKTILYCFFMPMLVTSRIRLHALVIIFGIALGFHGVLDGLKFLASGGGHSAYGLAKFGDNNSYALMMVMVLPILAYLYQYADGKYVKFGFGGMLMLVALAVISTNSRGGLLSIGIVAIWMIMHSRKKIQGMIVVFVFSIVMLQLAPESWFSRMDTIQTAGQDSSFMGRVGAWKRASAIALQNPVFGGGYHAGQEGSIFEEFRYKPGLLGFVDTPDVPYALASHSIYFEVLGDLGFGGLFIFLLCLGNAFITRLEILKIVKKQGSHLRWAADLSDMLAAALLAFAVGGAALSVAYFEFPYMLIMLMEVVKQQVLREVGKK